MCFSDQYLNMSVSLLIVSVLVCVCVHTDWVLEKAMHKCVLKPLRSMIEVALHDFQVRILVFYKMIQRNEVFKLQH